MSTDPYKGFAERYDITPNDLTENDPLMVDFFRRIFSENNVQSVLDCACGTGRHLMLFHNLGCQVWGSDVSEAMLAQARENLARYGIEISLKKIDYRNLPQRFHRSFDAVACLGSIGYMSNEREFLQAFRSMHAILREGGILVMTTITTDKQWKTKPRFKLVVNTLDITRLFVMDYFEQTVSYNILDAYHNQDANELKVWSAELAVLLRDEQERLLKAVGFRKVDFFGGFNFSSYDKTRSDRLITVAQK